MLSIKSKKVTVEQDNEKENKLQSGECLYDSHRLTTLIRNYELCDLTT